MISFAMGNACTVLVANYSMNQKFLSDINSDHSVTDAVAVMNIFKTNLYHFLLEDLFLQSSLGSEPADIGQFWWLGLFCFKFTLQHPEGIELDLN